jgi:hypothetical protein
MKKPKGTAPECIVCNHCNFDRGNGSPSRWYCSHPMNPDYVKHLSAATIISKGRRYDSPDNIPRKRTPGWCPKNGGAK